MATPKNEITFSNRSNIRLDELRTALVATVDEMVAIYELMSIQVGLMVVQANWDFLEASRALAAKDNNHARDCHADAQLKVHDAIIAQRNIAHLLSKLNSLKSSADGIPLLNRGQYCKDVTSICATVPNGVLLTKDELFADKLEMNRRLLGMHRNN